MQVIGNVTGVSLFISDLHLCASRPHITEVFIRFLQQQASQAQRLFILGDFFEYWAGDDDLDHAEHQAILSALRALHVHGTQVYLMHGNRDFLLGEAFAQACQLTLLNDPTMLEWQDQRILLSHGDALCTDDVAYMAFRQQVRNPAWQAQFLAQALAARKAQIAAIRERSEQEKNDKTLSIMDVNQTAVDKLLQQYDYPSYLIHGHTHRPNTHAIEIDHHRCERWVLGDWYEQGSYLKLDEQGLQAIKLAT
jgi:UDP-2,3-diacylglucosamine hydrolase